jgi:hypothetical protein
MRNNAMANQHPLSSLITTFLEVNKEEKGVAEEDIDAHLISAMILLTTRADVLKATYPDGRATDTSALYEDRGVDPDRVPPHLIERLRKYHWAFIAMQFAWLDLTGYSEPPCLSNSRMNELIKCTRELE